MVNMNTNIIQNHLYFFIIRQDEIKIKQVSHNWKQQGNVEWYKGMLTK